MHMEKHDRKNIRLSGFDYSRNGLYFITICTEKRFPYLSEIIPQEAENADMSGNNNVSGNMCVGADIIRPIVKLKKIGIILNDSINDIENHYNDVKAVKYCIMPDHVHIIISIMHDIYDVIDGRIISAPTLSTIIGSLKRYVSKTSGISVWQKGFYDHIIRSEKEFTEICNYIDNNPVNWANDIFDQNLWR